MTFEELLYEAIHYMCLKKSMLMPLSNFQHNLNMNDYSTYFAQLSDTIDVRSLDMDGGQVPSGIDMDDIVRPPVQSSSNLSYLVDKNQMFKSKCFYNRVDEREFEFINALNDDPYPSSTFHVNPDISQTTNDQIAINEFGHIIKPTDYNTTTPCKSNDPAKIRDLKQMIVDGCPIDVKAEFNRLLNSHHNKLIYNNSKSSILTDNTNFARTIKTYIAQPCSTPLCDSCVAWFIEVAANFRRHEMTMLHKILNSSYNTIASTDITTDKRPRKNQYTIFKIPHELVEIINHLNYYFKDIKDKLQFNTTTGYYELPITDLDGREQRVPVACKHVYMILCGDSLFKVSSECVEKGVCKYCGDNLDSVGFEDTTTLPRRVAEFIYTLMELYGCGSDDKVVFIYLYNLVADFIGNMVSRDDDNFDNKASSVAALFCYNVIKNHEPVVKPTTFLMTIAETLAATGFDEAKTQNIIASGIFGDTTTIYNTLIRVYNSSFYDFTEVFEKYADDDVKELKKNGQMESFNQMFSKLRFNTLHSDDYIKGFTEVEHTFTDNADANIHKKMMNTYPTFLNYIRKCCPANEGQPHTFGQKSSTCVKCGVDDKFKNVEEVFEKYVEVFEQDYVLEISNTLNLPTFEKIDIQPIIKANPEKAKTTIMNKLKISGSEFITLKRNILLNKAAIISTLKTWTHSDYEGWTCDEIMNMIVHIGSDELYGLLSADVYMDTCVVNAEDVEIVDDEED